MKNVPPEKFIMQYDEATSDLFKNNFLINKCIGVNLVIINILLLLNYFK